MRDKLKSFLSKKSTSDVLVMYGVQIATNLLPLILFPYLIRCLGANKWGMVLTVQSFLQIVILLIEYGFGISASRDVAQNRGDTDRLKFIVSGVLGAKLFLSFLGICITYIGTYLFPNIKEDPLILAFGLLWAISTGFSVLWYYQGIEKLKLVATLEVLFKTIAVLMIFIFIKSPNDAWKVLLLQGLAVFSSAFVGMLLMYHDLRFKIPNLVQTIYVLSMGKEMFLFRLYSSVYLTSPIFILGQTSSPQHVAYYAAGEKIGRLGAIFLEPISKIYMPIISRLVTVNKISAAKVAKKVFYSMFLIGFLFSIFLLFFASTIVHLLLGSEMLPALEVIHIFTPLLIIIASSYALAAHWMLPLKMDKYFNMIILVGGILNITLFLAFFVGYSYIGMAYSVLMTEFFIFCSIIVLLVLWKKTPWHIKGF